MRPEDRDVALLWDMLRFARETSSFVANTTWEDYQKNPVLRRAVERTVLVIGEAASRVSRTFRDAHPEIPWLPIITQRHRLVHDYVRIDDDKIWRVATEHVPRLITLLEPLIPPPPPRQE